MSKWKESEKEILRAIVKYDGKAESLAEVLNKSKLLEKRGIGIVQHGEKNMIFLKNTMYDDDTEIFDNEFDSIKKLNLHINKKNK